MYKNSINLIDCTLRDGGYYNNWHFSKTLVQKYFDVMNKVGIFNLEIGLITLETGLGLTGNIKKNFFKIFKINKNINCGIMINAKEFFDDNEKTINSKFIKIINLIPKEIKFIRFACHHNEVLPTIKLLEKKNISKNIFINIMQISNISKKELEKISKHANCSPVIKYLYIADSFGSLSAEKTKNILNIIKRNYAHSIGIHAHDNLGLALKNSLIAFSRGANWIDSTILGMGRGAGNLKTEDIIRTLSFDKKKQYELKNFIFNYFLNLKKKYRWGKNKFYRYGAKKEIHPTYIQELLQNPIYNKSEYSKILRSLNRFNTKKFNPYNLFNVKNFLKNNNNSYKKSESVKINRNILVIGPTKLTYQQRRLCSDLYKSANSTTIIALNSTINIPDKFIDYRITCHPQRIYSDINFHKKNTKKLIVPINFLNNNTVRSFKKNETTLYNYGIVIKPNKKEFYKSYKNITYLDKPIALLYLLSILDKKQISSLTLVGFRGFDKENPFQDDTQLYLNFFKEKNKKVKIKITKPTNYIV
jgi:4-hydroxy 2-oxovalerate aldolase